jgi:hypothetical protein
MTKERAQQLLDQRAKTLLGGGDFQMTAMERAILWDAIPDGRMSIADMVHKVARGEITI